MAELREWLDELYRHYNDRRFVSPDPLASLYRYSDFRDREIAGILAAGLAYGNVKSIVASVENLLARFGSSPRDFLLNTLPKKMEARIGSFRHRWTTADEVANFLAAAHVICDRHGSLGVALFSHLNPNDTDIQPALARWHAELRATGLAADNSLLSDPSKSSACKRLHLFLRWMIRCDAVDPGGWGTEPGGIGISPSLLLMPVDVHIHRIARQLRFTRRRAADLRAAREITRGFLRIAPDDPVKYDFALTRLPLHEKLRGVPLRRAIADYLALR